jgi:5-methyltetrahydrofolate--homocysteine methyltransferase
LEEFTFEYDPDNAVLKRLKEIFQKTRDRFEGRIHFGMADLGGIHDILSTFRPGEQLLFDLYDHPETVKTAAKKIDILWQIYFDEFAKDAGMAELGYTEWSGLYSKKSFSMTQCDFSYMIGPDMFREFIMPSIDAHCAHMDRVFYHLDGVGELPHVDLLLASKLDGIQWVPGANGGPAINYPDLYQRIRGAGKLLQFHGYRFHDMGTLVDMSGGGKGVQFQVHGYLDVMYKEEALAGMKAARKI